MHICRSTHTRATWACAEREIREEKKQSGIFTLSQHRQKFRQYFPPRLNTRSARSQGRRVTISVSLHNELPRQRGLSLVNIPLERFKRHIVCQVWALGRAFSLESLFVDRLSWQRNWRMYYHPHSSEAKNRQFLILSSRLPDASP